MVKKDNTRKLFLQSLFERVGNVFPKADSEKIGGHLIMRQNIVTETIFKFQKLL